MSNLLGKAWTATKADGLMKQLINMKVQNGRKYSTLAIRLQRLRVSQTPNGPRLQSASGLQQYLALANENLTAGLITPAAASQFAWTGEIYRAVKYFHEVEQRSNHQVSLSFYFILDEAGTRVKEFLIVDESDSRSQSLCGWVQASPAREFTEA